MVSPLMQGLRSTSLHGRGDGSPPGRAVWPSAALRKNSPAGRRKFFILIFDTFLVYSILVTNIIMHYQCLWKTFQFIIIAEAEADNLHGNF
jgi:hypothetical protein